MSKSQRTKGAAGEREWCKLLKYYGFPDVARLLSQARDGGGDVPAPPIMWEVKRRARISVYEFIEQAVAAVFGRNPHKCRIPAVAMRANNEEWLVLMRADDLLPILRAQFVDIKNGGAAAPIKNKT